MNIFESFGLSSYFPFKYIINDVIDSSQPGVLFEENFDDKKLFKTFTALWMGKKGTVEKEFSSDGFDGSRCLLIKNTGIGGWTLAHKYKIKVKKGDSFYMAALVKLRGDELTSYLSVAAYDINHEVINWNITRVKTDTTGEWIKIEKNFEISDDAVSYIKFKLGGKGRGEYWFDNVLFAKGANEFPAEITE